MQRNRATSLMLAAMLIAVMLAAPVTALAKFEELERGVPADVMDDSAIYDRFVALLGTDAEAIKAVQRECWGGRGAITGALGPQTQGCLRNHANVVARARKHAAEDMTRISGELDTARGEKASCDTALAECREKLATTAREHDELAERLKSGVVGDDYGELQGICKHLDASQLTGTCNPVEQVIRCVPDEADPLVPHLSCVPKRVSLEIKRYAPRPDGTAEVEFDEKPAKGTLTPAALPWQVPPQPVLPESPGTCDGAGGVLLCYVAPAALVVVSGLLLADAASEDFNLVTVRR